MIFAFIEGGILEVLKDSLEAQKKFEFKDVESRAVNFYDDKGVYLEPKLKISKSKRKFLGIFKRSSHEYDLVAKPNNEVDSFALALYETEKVRGNVYFSSLEELKTSLRAKGVEVDFIKKS